MEAYVKLEDVTKVYHMGEVEIRAADGINFEIMKGEFVVIVGPSGAGKTTVLNVLGGMDTATSGSIMVDGKDIRKDEVLLKHADWVEEFMPGYQEKGILVTRDNVWSILQEEVGKVFARVLEDAGVYKCDERGRRAFAGFLHFVGFEEV